MQQLVLRIRHAYGCGRVTVEAASDGTINNGDLYRAVAEAVKCGDVELYADAGFSSPISRSGATKGVAPGTFVHVKHNVSPCTVDMVDSYLRTLDGRTPRKPDPRLCISHGPHGMCEHCRPLEPWSKDVVGDAKHISLQAHMRKHGLAHVDVPEYSVHRRHERFCRSEHLPYPRGLCGKCQPSAITLQRQPFRVCDHVEFAGGMQAKVDAFLDRWRMSGQQHFAWLIGRFQPYTSSNVPLGVKAVVVDLWQPRQQENAADGFRLLDDWPRRLEDMERALRLLDTPTQDDHSTLLQIVGMIYTDLAALPEARGKVQYRRCPESFFLTGSEILFMADMQNAHPVLSREDNSKSSISRFVTCVVTGNADNDIEVFCYQASLQAQALRAANLVSPSTDANVVVLEPAVQEDANAVFVPSVIYARDNEYGVKVQHCEDRCVPVDYLIVNLSHGFSTDAAGPTRSLEDVKRAVDTMSHRDFEAKVVGPLLQHKEPQFVDNVDNDSGVMESAGWACPHCTFVNDRTDRGDCEMCGLPRQ